MDKKVVDIFIGISSAFGLTGLVVNLISIHIYNQKEFKTQPTTLYLIFSCILNIIISFLLPPLVIPSIVSYGIISCKIYFTLSTILQIYKPWILVFCSIDRLLTVVVPYKFKLKNQLKFQLRAIILLLVIGFLLGLPIAFFYEPDISSYENKTVGCPQESLLKYKWVKIYIEAFYQIIASALPFIIMLVSSVVTAWKLYKNKSGLKSKLNRRDMRREIQYGVSLVTMDVSFLVLRFPLMAFLILADNPNHSIIYKIDYSILVLVSGVHLFSPIFIFIFLNKIYRKYFLKLIRFKHFTNRVHPH